VPVTPSQKLSESSMRAGAPGKSRTNPKPTPQSAGKSSHQARSTCRGAGSEAGETAIDDHGGAV